MKKPRSANRRVAPFTVSIDWLRKVRHCSRGDLTLTFARSVGSSCLLIGAGPTGLILSQLLKQSGCSKVTLAANKEIKMDIARKIQAADECVVFYFRCVRNRYRKERSATSTSIVRNPKLNGPKSKRTTRTVSTLW